ncbi:MAG: creatininase family protein [Anaerolineae bacterium]
MRELNEVLWSTHTRAEFADLAARGAVIVVPIASTEQHGLHLPVDTDCRTVEYVSQRAACLTDEFPVLIAPLIAYGMSPHHMKYGGTISLHVETIICMLRDICESLIADGFERILILSGHGGNAQTIGAAAQELKYTLNREIRACCWFDLIPKTWQTVPEGPSKNIGHSGEAETSAILVLAPELVRRDRLVLVEGITDDPRRGTVAKGERILEDAVQALQSLLREMHNTPGHDAPGIEMTEK